MPRLQIECFHRVVPDDHEPHEWPYLLRGSAITASAFRTALQQLSQHCRFVDEVEATEILVAGRSTENTCWITFDDGYADNLQVAAPILTEFGIRPTLFFTTKLLEPAWHLPVDRWYAILVSATRLAGTLPGCLGGGSFDLTTLEGRVDLVTGSAKRRFIDASQIRQTELLGALSQRLQPEGGQPSPPMLDTQGLTTLSDRGWSIGPHGHSHQLLPVCSPKDRRAEIELCIRALKALPVRHSKWFAYADGVADKGTVEDTKGLLTSRGYVGALTFGAHSDSKPSRWKTARGVGGSNLSKQPGVTRPEGYRVVRPTQKRPFLR